VGGGFCVPVFFQNGGDWKGGGGGGGREGLV